jgi:predicted SAM-dependent methyltransferase
MAKRSLADLGVHVSRQVRHRRRLERYCRGKYSLLLNVGCGKLIKAGWVNIDCAPHDGAFYFDALDRFPIADNSVRHIHCEHFLEHLEFDDACMFLKDCYRVLTQGGTLRIIVPDAERYMRAYAANETAFFQQLEHLGGTTRALRPKNMVCNQAFRMGGDHLFCWDFETLEAASKKIGFHIVRQSAINDIANELNIDGQDWWRPVESLYVNLEK